MFKDKYKKRKKKRIIKRLVIIVAEDDNFTLLSIRGRWNFQKLMEQVSELEFFKNKKPLKLPIPQNSMPQA
jgi:hypothetical protein